MFPAEVKHMRASVEGPIIDVGRRSPGGHYFGAAHTMSRYQTAFYQPILSDWRNFEQWRDDGAATAEQRANGIWKALLQAYEPPPLDPAIREELQAYVARRKEEYEKSAA